MAWLAAWWVEVAGETKTYAVQSRHTPSGSSFDIPFESARSARPCPVPCGCGQKLVQPTISPCFDSPLEVWACPSSLRAPLTRAPNRSPCAGPLLLQRTGDIQGISHIACICVNPRTARYSANPARSSVARCPSAVRCRPGHQQSRPCHCHTTLPDTICLYRSEDSPNDIIILSSRCGRAVVNCLEEESLALQGCPTDNVLPGCLVVINNFALYCLYTQ